MVRRADPTSIPALLSHLPTTGRVGRRPLPPVPALSAAPHPPPADVFRQESILGRCSDVGEEYLLTQSGRSGGEKRLVDLFTFFCFKFDGCTLFISSRLIRFIDYARFNDACFNL